MISFISCTFGGDPVIIGMNSFYMDTVLLITVKDFRWEVDFTIGIIHFMYLCQEVGNDRDELFDWGLFTKKYFIPVRCTGRLKLIVK